PSDHLDGVVQIIKKKNTLSQNDEKIEIDIDSVDIETLWELDRYITNYRNNLSKVRRRAEIQQARALAGNDTIQNPVVSVPEAPNEKRAGTGVLLRGTIVAGLGKTMDCDLSIAAGLGKTMDCDLSRFRTGFTKLGL
nr:hypothetical protein [Tanacetum cinerariifolium]